MPSKVVNVPKDEETAPRGDALCALRDQLEAYHREGWRLYRYCYAFLDNAEDAEDAAQEVFVLAFRYLESYRSEATLLTWLGGLARHHCLNQLRRKAAGSLDNLPESAQPHASPEPLEAAERGVLCQQVRAAIEAKAAARNPPWDDDDYFIFEVYYTGPKKTWPEMACILGKPVDTVKYHYYRHVLPTLREVGAELSK